jgi:hypothetical protein
MSRLPNYRLTWKAREREQGVCQVQVTIFSFWATVISFISNVVSPALLCNANLQICRAEKRQKGANKEIEVAETIVFSSTRSHLQDFTIKIKHLRKIRDATYVEDIQWTIWFNKKEKENAEYAGYHFDTKLRRILQNRQVLWLWEYFSFKF